MSHLRELDALVAEKVMGCETIKDRGSAYQTCGCKDFPHGKWTDIGGAGIMAIPRYSTDIAAAWEILPEMTRRGFPWCIEQADTAEFPTVHVINPTEKEKYEGPVFFIEDMERISEGADSTPHAICLAALKAVGA